MRIYSKLSIVFLVFITVPVMFVSYIVFYNSKNIIEKEAFSKLNAIADMDVRAIDVFFSIKETKLDMDMVYKIIQDNPDQKESQETLLVKKTPDNKVVFISPLKYESRVSLTKAVTIGEKYALPAQKSALRESGFGLSIDYRGKEVLSAWRPIPYLEGYWLIIKVDSEEAFLPIEKLRKLLIVVILITIFSTALTVFAIAKSISEPIQELHRGTEIIGAGNLDYRVGTDTKDEVGQLARAFDTMTSNLKTSAISIKKLDKEILERKNTEEKLNQLLKEEIQYREITISILEDNNQVREQLENSMESLREAQSQLIRAEKMEVIGRMAAGIAHEVKNPLGIILQGVNYFEGTLPPEEKDSREILQMMKDGVKRADSIVRALLDFSRFQELKIEQRDINTIIGSSIGLIQYKLKINSIECVCELGKDLPKVLIDMGKIEQVFVNLFNNAADVMPTGGKLYIRSYLSELKTPENKIGNRGNDIFRLKEEAIIVEVEDTGPGIGEDVINKIFDPFFTTKSRAEGTGLGLSVAKSIIDMHKGLINVKSEKGKGAKFTIVFKIAGKGNG